MHHSKLCKECSLCSALCQMISSALGEGFEQGCWQIKVLLVCFKIVIHSFLILTKHALYMGHWKRMQEEGWSFLLHAITSGWSCLWGSASLTGGTTPGALRHRHSPLTGEEGQGIQPASNPHELLQTPVLYFCMEQCRKPCVAWCSHYVTVVCSILLKPRVHSGCLSFRLVCCLFTV